MAFNERRIFPNDQRPSVAIGFNLPMNEGGVFTPNFQTKDAIKNNLINHLNSLLKDLLNEARGNFCNVNDLHSIIMVGGGTQIPLIKESYFIIFTKTYFHNTTIP